MKNKKPLLCVAAAAMMLAAGVPCGAQRLLIDDVVAVVGDDAIWRSDIEYQYEQSLIDGVNYNGDMKCNILEQLLIQKLMVNQAKLDSIEVSENDVVNRVDARMNYFIQQVGGQDKLEEYFNKSLMQIKRDQMDMVRTQMLTDQMQADITKDIKISPSEIRDYYHRMPEDSIPYVPAQYALDQIVIYPEVDQAEVDRVKGRLRDFQKQVAEGRDFATLAVLYSEDPGSASRGGDLGWYTKAGFVPEFSAVAFNLQEKGKVSKIVQTEFGYHIIQLIDRKGERINVRHILMKPKVNAAARTKAEHFLDTMLVLMNDGKATFDELAKRFSMDKDTRSNGGAMINPQDGSVKFELSQIPAEIAKAIQGLEEGGVSKPFAMIDERKGRETYRIVRLRRRHAPHRANMREDYNLLQGIMEEQKRKQTMNDWIIAKQRETYINISPEWQNCEFKYKNWVR